MSYGDCVECFGLATLTGSTFGCRLRQKLERRRLRRKKEKVEEDAMTELVSTYISLSCLYTIFVQGSRV